MKCGKCSSSIDARLESFVVCEGDCAKSYHIDCVGVLESHMESLAVNNILWMCDGCLDVFYKKRSGMQTDKLILNSSSRFESELADIKSQIHDIVRTLTNITSQSFPEAIVQSSTPLSSTKLLDGTGPACTLESSSEESNCYLAPCSAPKQMFSLFLTNIDSSVTERDVDCMVRQVVGIEKEEAINVFKLMPKGKNLGLLEYASFKVILNTKWKSVVMDSATWPPGIKFREFLSSRGRTWSPNANSVNS